jgi:hypothetical protein
MTGFHVQKAVYTWASIYISCTQIQRLELKAYWDIMFQSGFLKAKIE